MKLQNKQMKELQRISGLSKEEAKQILLSEVEKTITAEKAAINKRKRKQGKRRMLIKNARELLGYAIQKCAADHTSETTVSIVCTSK